MIYKNQTGRKQTERPTEAYTTSLICMRRKYLSTKSKDLEELRTEPEEVFLTGKSAEEQTAKLNQNYFIQIWRGKIFVENDFF